MVLVLAYRNRDIYSESDVDAEEKKEVQLETIQCPYWFINVLFSDEFADDFACTGDVTDRQVLDFWGKQPTINNSRNMFMLLFPTRLALAVCIVLMISSLSTVGLIQVLWLSMIGGRSSVLLGKV